MTFETVNDALVLNAINRGLVVLLVALAMVVAGHLLWLLHLNANAEKPNEPARDDSEWRKECYNQKMAVYLVAKRLFDKIVKRTCLLLAAFVALLAIDAAFPSSNEIIEMRFKLEASKVLTADTAKVVAEEVLKRVDKALEQAK